MKRSRSSRPSTRFKSRAESLGADRNKEATRLLKRGLNHYGLGDLDAAIECWERARAIDPENNAVHDYLANAYQERDMPLEFVGPEDVVVAEEVGAAKEVGAAEEVGVAEADDDPTPFSELDLTDEAPDPNETSLTRAIGDVIVVKSEDHEELIADALAAYKLGELDHAWKNLDQVAKADPERLDVQGYLKLVGNARAEKWTKQIGDQGRTLSQNCKTEEMLKLRLDRDEGYMLSQVDGTVSISDLISLSTCSRNRALEVLARLIREKIVA